jgi:hypothetical protein
VTVDSASSLCYHTHCSDGAHRAGKFGSSSERLVIFVKGETYLCGNVTAFFSLWRSLVCVSLRAYQSPQMKTIRGNALLSKIRNGENDEKTDYDRSCAVRGGSVGNA